MKRRLIAIKYKIPGKRQRLHVGKTKRLEWYTASKRLNLEALKDNLKTWNMARTAIICETENRHPCDNVPAVELSVIFSMYGQPRKVTLAKCWIHRGAIANPHEVYITSGGVLDGLEQHSLELMNGREIPLCLGNFNLMPQDVEEIPGGIQFKSPVIGYDQRSPSDEEYEVMLDEYRRDPARFGGDEAGRPVLTHK